MLVARDLSFGYSGRTIGRSVNLAIEKGDALALLGPNGGGKTTLLKTLMGLIPAQGGAIMIDGKPLADLSIQERARLIGYVPQIQSGVFAFTAREVVLMGRTAHGGLFARPTEKDHAIADETLARMGVVHLAGRPVTMISGGERQLVLIARALAQEPRLIVLDEPTASLDFGNQGKVMREVSKLAGEGVGVIFTTHDPNQAERYASRVAMLRDGRLSEPVAPDAALGQGSLEALYGAPVELLADSDGRRAFLPG